MKRVQMILEEWQHEWLATEAERQSTTMSGLLRELITAAIEQRQAATLADDPLWGIIGIGAGPNDGVTSENLDTFLYRADWKEANWAEEKPVELLAVAEDDSNYR